MGQGVQLWDTNLKHEFKIRHEKNSQQTGHSGFFSETPDIGRGNGRERESCREDLEMKAWRKTRLDRMMVEYLLRQGYYDSALQLAENSKVTHLSNTEVKSILKEPFNKKFHPGCSMFYATRKKNTSQNHF